ncbi:MAG: hypothetical protein ACX93P_01330 [Roseovarius sp.]
MRNDQDRQKLKFSITREEANSDDPQEVALGKLDSLYRDVDWKSHEQQHAFERGIALAVNVFCAVQVAKNVGDEAASAGGCFTSVSVSLRHPLASHSSDA